ncbi:MAG: HmuY family protein [Proteobacteria bacterium]|nr:HmuY family protein [Pseudomonadota bacterium]
MTRMSEALFSLLLGVALGVAQGCAPQLDTPADKPFGGGGGAPEGTIVHEDPGDGTTITRVDASDSTVWVYLNLSSKEEIVPDSPDTSADWDMGFQRSNVKINGGVSGSGNVEIAALTGQEFGSLSQAPDTGYITDEPDTPVDQGGDENDKPDYAFDTGDSRWWDYNPANHVLTPRDITYVLHSVDGHYYKLEILSYYNDAGASGYLSFRWQEIADPSNT